MSSQTIKRRRQPIYEERDAGSSAPGLILAAIVLFGVAVLMLYIAVAEPQPGTLMGAIQDILRGLGGSLAPAMGLIPAWAGLMCVFALRGKPISPLKVIADALLIVCLFTAVHVFFAERVVLERMTIRTFANFVAKSYGYGAGGGAIGALLGWPLYRSFGAAGGFIAVLFIAALLLTVTGRMGRFVRWCGAKSGQLRDNAERRREENEHAFDVTPVTCPARSRRAASRDPLSEEVLGGASPAPQTARRQARTARQPARDPFQGRPLPNDDGFGGRPARAANQPAARRTRPAEPIVEPAPVAPAAPAEKPKRKAAPKKKKEKLYIENVEAANSAPDPLESLGPKEDFDDFDMLDAESILRDKAEADAKWSFKPDRPKLVKEEGPIDLPDEEIAKAQASMEALKIEPDAYEAPDDDETPNDDAPPFDVPAPGIAEKVKPALPKLKRTYTTEPEPEEEEPVYNYPPIDLLAEGESYDVSGHAKRDMEKAKLLEETLKSFGIQTRLLGIAHGPAVTRFELQPAAGIKVSRITSLSDDIAMNLAAMSVRIEAPIPGKAAVGVEIPNDKIEMVRLRDVLESNEARKHPSKIAVGMGKDNSGRYIVADIAKMPHVLIAGQTGSGKSVCINAIITSILFRASPEEVRLILIDPKVVELSIYNDIPHLVCPVVTDPKKAASALDWAVAEMTMRYKKFAERGVRDIKGYNKSLKEGEPIMPQMVIIIDELADLMMVSPGEVEDSICRIAQLARACGMHLVIATQRPSVNVITGIIKANIPTRIAFSVASQVDSRTMIDHGGAEKLLGNGDMLFLPNGSNKPMRVQGAWVSDEEVHAIVEYIKQSAETNYDPDMQEHLENAVRTDAEKEEFASEYDPKLPEAVDIVLELGQASISMLQRRMRIGYARAGRIIDEMAQRGIVSEADGAKPRAVLITREEANAMFEQ